MNKCTRIIKIYQALKLIDNPLKPSTFKEERNWLKHISNYSRRKANISSPSVQGHALKKIGLFSKEFLSN